MNVLDLVRASEKDIGSGSRNVRRYAENFNATTAAAAVTVNGSTCPPDTVRFIHTFYFSVLPGAAQTFQSINAFNQDAAGNIQGIIGSNQNYTPVAAQSGIFTISALEFVLMQGDILVVSGNFSAGAAANAINAWAMGWEFPRGNLQR